MANPNIQTAYGGEVLDQILVMAATGNQLVTQSTDGGRSSLQGFAALPHGLAHGREIFQLDLHG